MRILALSLAVFLLAAPEREPAVNYYPLQPGTKWHYRVEAGGGKGELLMHAAKVEKINDQSLTRLEASTQGKVTGSEHIRQDAGGIFRHRVNGLECDPPLCLLRYPVKDGDTWDNEVRMGAEKVKITCRVGKEDVEVPAGKYKAVTVRLDFEQAGQKINFVYWLVPNIGVVKQTGDLGGQTIKLELEKFEVGGK